VVVTFVTDKKPNPTEIENIIDTNHSFWFTAFSGVHREVIYHGQVSMDLDPGTGNTVLWRLVRALWPSEFIINVYHDSGVRTFVNTIPCGL